MRRAPPFLGRLALDLKISLLFHTRLPLRAPAILTGEDVARAGWASPVAGAVVGALGAAAYGLSSAVGLPPVPSALLALAATLAASGGLHEDGLADTADGFGGGATRERKLEIMKDSRIGTFGACALVLSLLLRGSALASLSAPALVAPALIATHAAARATLPVFMRFVPPARSGGLSAGVGPVPGRSAAGAALLGVLALVLGFDAGTALIALVALVAGMAAMARLCRRQIGGQTGDVLGALEQTVEILILLVAAARLAPG